MQEFTSFTTLASVYAKGEMFFSLLEGELVTNGKLEHTVLVVANGTYNITLANIHRGTPCAPIVNGDGIAVAERAVKRLGHAGGIVGRIYRTILEGSIRT